MHFLLNVIFSMHFLRSIDRYLTACKLSPIIFFIFVGDIDEGFLHAFADDTKIVLKVETKPITML